MTCVKDFELLKKLGQGSFSSVFKVRRKSDGQEYAMKKVKMNGLSNKEKVNALNEVRILASIQSPYIISYKEAFAEDNVLYLILEYSGGGDLKSKIDYVKAKGVGYYFDEQIIWTYFIYLLKGLHQLHKRSIFHRDIKCANIFLSKDHRQLKLGDLNVAKVVAKNKAFASTQAGTPYYASPEVWKDLPYDSRCDVWSLGCVLYEMAALHPPFLAKDLDGLAKKVIRGSYEGINARYSKDLTNVISQCLQVNPKKRMTTEQLLMMDEIQQRINLDEYYDAAKTTELLNTIQLPKNMKDLKTRLPKPQYNKTEISELQPEMVNKQASKHSLIDRTPLREDKLCGQQEQKEMRVHFRLLDEKRELRKAVRLPPINSSQHENEASQQKQKLKHHTPILKRQTPKFLSRKQLFG